MTTLRRSCSACARAKHRCDLQTPRCSRCVKRNTTCIFVNEPLTAKSPLPPAPNASTISTNREANDTNLSLVRLQSARNHLSDTPELPLTIGAGYHDPFDTLPQTGLPRARVRGLIHHFLTKIAFQYYPLDLDPKTNPFVVSWWPLALKDPALFHVSLQTASLDDELLAQKGFASSDILMADSVSLLRRKVENPILAIQDETMDAVVTLAAIEYGKGNIQTSKMHISGVKRMVEVRGGIQKVKESSPITARMVPWVSMLVLGVPQFPTQDDEGFGDGISAISLWKDSSIASCAARSLMDLKSLHLNPVLEDTITRLRNIFGKYSRHSTGLATPLELSSTDLHDLTCFVLHRLLPLPAIEDVNALTADISDAMHCATSIFMFIIHGHTYYTHITILNSLVLRLKTHLECMEVSTNDISPVFVWLHSVGMVASTEIGDSQWFLDRARLIANTLDIRSWDDILANLECVLWFHNSRTKSFKHQWVHILTGELPDLAKIGT
ncbi:hypothetical protein BGZ60DRAFT_242153 [Tricladium varicosporioides]|nr:hypothetical protein BGZ60DRAFT_242153 [Hymenoscyphus varicosporioides]